MKLKKRVLTYILIIFCSISSFAAVVGDSDGAAFVTKAEFEEMKNNFNLQIDRYNESIDSKIDGVIASYIDGIRILLRETRKPLISSTDHWLMYNKNDYPTYQDGKPYVSGFTSQGNARVTEAPNTDANYMLYVGIIHNGKAAYKTNGGFKKHIVGKPSKNLTKNGNNNYVSEWQGYYQNEGEIITLSSFVPSLGSGVWAAWQQDRLRWMTVTSFSNSTCPVTVGDIRFTNATGGYWTGLTIKCSAAQRKIGEIVGDTYVSIYQDISDNRFWDSTMTNKMGITPTTPAITYTAKGTAFKTWMEDVIASNKIDWSCSNRARNASGYWKVENTDGCYSSTATVTNIIVDNADHNHYLLKMANDPNNLQFVRLWSAKTDAIAESLNQKYEDSNTSSSEKNQIKSALLWDEDNTPHLSMGAGYPFLEVSYDEEVDFTFKIKESGSYRMYAKYGPFSPTGNAATEADVTFDITSGSTTTHSTTLPVTGGVDTKMKFKVTKDGTNYIFLKWCDTTTNKSGTLDLSNDPIVLPAI